VQAVVLTLLFGFLVLGIMGYGTYSGQPPISEKVVDPAGETVFTGEDIREGQKIFLRNGLMEYGSVFGHGGYLGPDYTADYLRRSALAVRDHYGGGGSDRAAARTLEDFKKNRYDPEKRTLEFTEAQAAAFGKVADHYGRYFGGSTTRYGLRPEAITDQTRVKQLTAFFGWSAWAAAAERPGKGYSYTNDWPPEPLVGNEATGNTVVWSVISLMALLGGLGLLFGALGRWSFLGWHGRDQQSLSFRTPGEVALTPAQRVCAPTTLWSWPPYFSSRRSSGPPQSTTGRTWRASSGWIWPGSFLSTSSGPGTCSSPSSGRRPHFSRRASFSRP
jgi:nitric oxide reductase subunit B